MISRRLVATMLMLTAVLSANAEAQVRPLGQVPVDASSVQPACHGCGGCDDCAGGHSGGFYGGHHGGHYGGVVWGTQCFDCGVKPGLYPPCPNPCRTTLVGELVHGVKHVVDAGLSKVFHCVFSCGYCKSCGYDSCHCGGAYSDGYVDDYQGGTIVESEMQPVPARPQAEEGDPFGDDPMPQGSGTRSTMRSLMPSAKAMGPASTRRSVRPVANQKPVRKRIRTKPTYRKVTATARPRVKVRPTSTTRPVQRQLRQVPVQPTAADPSLRFRD